MKHESYLQYWVNHLSFQLRRSLAQRFQAAGHDVTAEDWAVLLILQSQDQLTATELSARSLRDKTTVTRMVDRLERKGLVQRRRDGADRRSVQLSLSDAGLAAFNVLRVIAEELIAESLSGISDQDQQITRQTLQRMMSNITDNQGAPDDL